MVCIDRAIKMKNLLDTKYDKNENNSCSLIADSLTISLNAKQKTEEIDLKFNRINKSRHLDIKLKFSSSKKAISRLIIKEDKSKMANLTKFLSKHLSVDINLIITICVVFLLNFHFIPFLQLFSEKCDSLNYLKRFEGANLNSLNIFQENSFYSKRCSASKGSDYEKFLRHVWFWFDMSTYSYLPFCVMCISSLVIVFEFKKVNAHYAQLISNESHYFNKMNFLKKIRKNRKICLMLLKSAAFFLVLTAQYWSFFLSLKNKENKNAIHKHLISFSHILLYGNHVFNFLIFGISSSSYRLELNNLFGKKSF